MERGAGDCVIDPASTITYQIVQEKFRRGETVKALLHAYQRVGVETSNRILALVSSNATYAIFSFALACKQPSTFSDLIIDNIFPIGDGFKLESEVRNTISVLGFCLQSKNASQSIFYPSNPNGLDEFTSFKLLIDEIFGEYRQKWSCYPAVMKSVERAKDAGEEEDEEPDAELDSDDLDDDYTADFGWLSSYRRQNYQAIDRGIADGSKPLIKGESKFQDELKKHEHEYIVNKTYRVYCATWNVNGQPCNNYDMRPWLTQSDDPPDIYAIAFQELDLSPKAITFNETRPDKSVIHNIMRSLHDENYEELCSVRLVGMMLTIVVKRALRPNITRCETQTVGTGALNLMGNKGGVGVSLTLNEDDLCFVNSHLAAHVGEVQRRNDDFAEINKRLMFTMRDINRHDHVFWIGDLNYRLNPLSTDLIVDCETMLVYDQLRNERAARRVFEDYNEGDIKFQPTYKYDPGTDNWDSSEKHRAPAWCDRILWKGDKIKQTAYGNVMRMRLSDHKPVYATFLTDIKTKDEQKYKQVHEKILKRVDKYENDNQPQITVEKTDIDFDEIKFNEEYFRDFTVANNCHLPVEFSFKNKTENDMRICEDWISVDPCFGTLITGRSLSIRVKIHVKSESVSRLNRKQENHSGKIPLDILVLHVKNGRDIFITIMGEYKPSCFGFSVETLCRMDRPIFELTWQDVAEIQNKISEPYKVTMPREIFLLIDYLYKVGMQEANLFQVERTYRVNENINEIRDWLDSCSIDDFPGTPHTAAEALLMLLESAEEPLLHPISTEILNPDYPFELCLRAVHKLTTPRKNVFLYLTMFLHELIEQNRNSNIDVIAKIFGFVLIKTNSGDSAGLRRKNFLKRFLSKEIFSFARNEFQYSNSNSMRDE